MHESGSVLLSGIAGLGAADGSNSLSPSIEEQLTRSEGRDADFVILGSGPGGYYAAIRAAQLGARVVVVEKGSTGGTCLNVGCIPTKALLSCVQVLQHVKAAAQFGVKIADHTLDIAAMMKHKDRVVKQLVTGVEFLLRKNKVNLVRGVGRIEDPHTVVVESDSGAQAFRGDRIIIATGSAPAALRVPGLEIGEDVWTSTEALTFDRVPKSLLIIGAGAIGLEAAYTFAPMGTKVRVVEMMGQILPAADSETADELQKGLERAGIEFSLDSTVIGADDSAGGKTVRILSGDKEETGTFEKVLVAVGRRAVIDGIGLDNVGVAHDSRRILVDEHMQTNVPSIYAVGDCVGDPMLAHVAWAEGVVAVEHSLGMESRMRYDSFPACVYTTPECASVGLTEAQARERYQDVRIGKSTFSHNGKAMGIGEAEGFIKFVADARYGRILGVHMVGPRVTDLVTQAAIAIRNELTIDEVIATIHPHPTLSEVMQEAAMDTQGRAVHQ